MAPGEDRNQVILLGNAFLGRGLGGGGVGVGGGGGVAQVFSSLWTTVVR